jgi:hypothetical protein
LSILKVDCEYCEFDFFPRVFADLKEKKIDIGIIDVEIHGMDQIRDQAIWEFFNQADEVDMRLISRDPNVPYCGGHECSEFALISGKEAFKSHVVYRCPEFYDEWQTLWESQP